MHPEFVSECVSAVLDYFAIQLKGRYLIEFRYMTGEGRVAQELHQQLMDRKWVTFQTECTIRALLKPHASAEAYLERALRGRRRKELRRLEKRLNELGETEYRAMEPNGDAQFWIDGFLELEASGWKGEAATSMASRKESREFFVDMAQNAHRYGKLEMLGLFHQNKAIALKCNVNSGGGAFAYKIAYDEKFGKFSPGLLLEMENIRRFHLPPKRLWMDSTADSEHFMINRLWLDRRTVETLLVSPNGAWGNFIVATLPLIRWLKSIVHSRRRK